MNKSSLFGMETKVLCIGAALSSFTPSSSKLSYQIQTPIIIMNGLI